MFFRITRVIRKATNRMAIQICKGTLKAISCPGDVARATHMDVSENSGTPKSSILFHFNRVFHFFHHPFWGSPIFGNTHIYIYIHAWNPLMTFVLIEKGLLLEGSNRKIEDNQVPGVYILKNILLYSVFDFPWSVAFFSEIFHLCPAPLMTERHGVISNQNHEIRSLFLYRCVPTKTSGMYHSRLKILHIHHAVTADALHSATLSTEMVQDLEKSRHEDFQLELFFSIPDPCSIECQRPVPFIEG